jgi:hypothetical protein
MSDLDLCIHCQEPTNPGSGKFVNRLPSDDGFACSECAGFNCDFCDTQIVLDQDHSGPDGYGHYHETCLSKLSGSPLPKTKACIYCDTQINEDIWEEEDGMCVTCNHLFYDHKINPYDPATFPKNQSGSQNV